MQLICEGHVMLAQLSTQQQKTLVKLSLIYLLIVTSALLNFFKVMFTGNMGTDSTWLRILIEEESFGT